MGIYDRDYNRPKGGGMFAAGGSGGGGSSGLFMRSPGWTVTTWIIVINVAIHILAAVLFSSRTGNPLNGAFYEFGGLNVADAFFYQQIAPDGSTNIHINLQVWRLLTFQFLHDPTSIWHLFFNMFGMWIFGPMVEQYLGRKKYLAYYLVCGLFGGLLFIVLTLLSVFTPINLLNNGIHQQLIGASAGVFGVIVACAYIQPNTVVQLLFPPIPMKMKWFAYGYVGLALFSLLGGSSNAGGEAAHIGGAVAGFYFIRNSHHLLDFFDIFNDSRAPKGKKPKRDKRTKGGASDAEIDKILEKVSASGIGSLSEKEKRMLNEASRKQRGED